MGVHTITLVYGHVRKDTVNDLFSSSFYFSILWVRGSMMRILEKLLSSVMSWNLLKIASCPLDQVGFWLVRVCESCWYSGGLLMIYQPVTLLSFCVVYHPQTGYSNRSRCNSASSSVTGSAHVEAPAPPQAQPQASGYTSRPNVPHKQVTCTQEQCSLLSHNSRKDMHLSAHTNRGERERALLVRLLVGGS